MKEFFRNRLRDGIFGIQDGLISTLGALLGIAVGTQDAAIVALSGFVIVTVESLSMAAGSYISSKSQREYLERLLKEEEETIRRDPEGERREIRDMYAARGFTDEEIKMIEKRLFADKTVLLEDMAHKELGICPRALEEPKGNAVVMGFAYIIGGSVPVLPYLLVPIHSAMIVSITAAVASLFLLGGLKGKLVRRNWWRSGIELLVVAGFAALAGYVIGSVARRWIL